MSFCVLKLMAKNMFEQIKPLLALLWFVQFVLTSNAIWTVWAHPDKGSTMITIASWVGYLNVLSLISLWVYFEYDYASMLCGRKKQ